MGLNLSSEVKQGSVHFLVSTDKPLHRVARNDLAFVCFKDIYHVYLHYKWRMLWYLLSIPHHRKRYSRASKCAFQWPVQSNAFLKPPRTLVDSLQQYVQYLQNSTCCTKHFFRAGEIKNIFVDYAPESRIDLSPPFTLDQKCTARIRVRWMSGTSFCLLQSEWTLTYSNTVNINGKDYSDSKSVLHRM